MKNAKKWLAIASALCMVVPSMTAFAGALPNETTSTGKGAIEYDPKEVPKYFHVVLPTIGNNTYDFVLDPMKVLAEYDKGEYSGANADDVNAFFKSTTMGKTLKATTAGETLHAYEYVELDSTTNPTLTAALAEFVSGGAIQASNSEFYVWTPDTSDAGKPDGTWVKLDATNVLQYCTALDAANNEVATGIDHLALNQDCKKDGEAIFDGKLYALQPSATPLVDGTYDVTDYVTLNTDGITIAGVASTGAGFCVKDSSGTTKIDSTNLGRVEVVKEVVKNTNTSDKFVIVNKSSAATGVKAEVTVQNPEGLEFLAAAPTGTDLGVNVFMQIENASGAQNATPTVGTAAVVAEQSDGSVKGTVTVNLAGADDLADYIAYQGPVIPETGGHEIMRYNNPNMIYEMAALNLKVETNDVAAMTGTDQETAEAAWGEYVKGLKEGTYTKPSVDVVYTLINDVNAPAYTAITGNYGNDGSIWFALNPTTGGLEDHSKLTAASVKQTDGSFTPVSSADLAKIEFDATLKWAKVTWANLVAIGHPSSEGTVVMRFTYDGTDYEVTVTP